MAGGYRRLFDQVQPQPQGMQATPVHHEKNPKWAELLAHQKKIEAALQGLSPTDTGYERLKAAQIKMYNIVGDIGYAHEESEALKEPTDLDIGAEIYDADETISRMRRGKRERRK